MVAMRTSVLLAALFCGMAQAEESTTGGQWSLLRQGPLDAAVTRLETGERLGLLCAADQDDCAWFLQPGWACEDGKPALVRLEGEQGILRLGGECKATALGPLVVFNVDLAAFVRGSPAIEASLVSPGKERVTLRFANAGAAAAIEQARVAHAARRAPLAN